MTHTTHSHISAFRSLETLYQAFDKIAVRRKIFKVETIGDCYVAGEYLRCRLVAIYSQLTHRPAISASQFVACRLQTRITQFRCVVLRLKLVPE